MATLMENANRIAAAKTDMKLALTEKGIVVPDTDLIDTYGNKIRELSDVKVYRKVCDFSAGSWSGPTLSNSSWVGLVNETLGTSNWIYYYENGVVLDPSKIVFISGSIIEPTNWIRVGRGYAQNSTTAQYQYMPYMSAYGDNIQSGNGISGDIFYESSNNTAMVSWFLDHYHAASSNAGKENGRMNIIVCSDKIYFQFCYNKRGLGAIKSASPKFEFTIGFK